MMVSLYGWPTQEKWWSHCMGDLPKKNNGLIVWVTYPRGRILSKLHAFLRNSFNMRSLLATFLDECRSTRSFLVISNNLESHRAIPFTKAKTWSSFCDLHRNTRSLLAISFIQTTWNPIWRFLLYKSWNLRSLLATSSKYEIPSGDLNNLESHLAIPFYRMLSMSFFLLAWFENHYLLFLLF